MTVIKIVHRKAKKRLTAIWIAVLIYFLLLCFTICMIFNGVIL